MRTTNKFSISLHVCLPLLCLLDKTKHREQEQMKKLFSFLSELVSCLNRTHAFRCCLMSYRISFVLRTYIMYINVDVVWKCGLCEDFLLCLFSHCPDQVSETQRKPKIQKLLNNMCAMVAVCWCWERIACFLYNPLSCAVHVVSLLFVFCRLRSPGFIISFCSAIPSFVILRCISLALSFPACVQHAENAFRV